MKWTCVMVLAALAAGCAGNGPPSADDRDALARSEAKRELERECRIAAQTRTYNPDCPQSDRYESAPPPQRGLPAPPPVRLPGT